jgi:uncharacterized membrane protein
VHQAIIDYHCMYRFFVFFFSVLAGFSAFAQSQDLITRDDVPVDFSNPWNIVLYIVFPLLLVIFYLYWSKTKRKEREENRKNNKS